MQENQSVRKQFRFHIDVVMEGVSEEEALSKLQRILQQEPDAAESRITSVPLLWQSGDRDKEEGIPAVSAGDTPHLTQLIERLRESNVLVTLTVNKGRGIRMNLPCRILNFDAASGNLSVYHVDEKQVYLLRLNEIDDFIVH